MSAGRFETIARAKVNLSLRVLGRRPDNYHELESLVVFASVGDVLQLDPSPAFSLTTSGEFGFAIDGDNLIAKAHATFLAAASAIGARPASLTSGAFRLAKCLPVAAGLGGGSADAAAALRLLRQVNPHLADHIDWMGLAQTLGADVPVCFAERAAVMTGIGEIVCPLATLPPAAIVLANPRIPLATADVFRELRAQPVEVVPAQRSAVPTLATFAELRRELQATRNDLEPVARHLCPAIGAMLAVLGRMPGAHIARMSGSGPTCFALFESLTEADAAAATLRRDQPGWWIAAAAIG